MAEISTEVTSEVRENLIDVIRYEVAKLRLWKWIAIISIALHLLRSC